MPWSGNRDSPRGAVTAATRAQVASPPEVRAVVGALMVGMVLSALDAMIVSTALPTIAGELGGLDHLSWVVTAYLLTTTAAVPIAGKLSDLYGRRPLFQAAVLIFVAGSVAAGLSQTMTQLIAARGLQGIGGGGLQALTFVILADVVAPRERARYIGAFTTVFAVSSVVGPLIGGVLTDALTWRWAFYVNVPLGAVTIFVASRKLHAPVPRGKPAVDILGMALLLPAVSCFILVTVWGGKELAWGSRALLGLLLAAVTSSVLFVIRETRAPEPLIPLTLFRIQAITVPTVISVFLGMAMVGGMTFLPLYLQVVGDASATTSGLLMIPVVGGFVVSTNLVGRLISSTGRYKVFVVVGTAAATFGLGLLALLDERTSIVHTAVGMFVFGIGIGSAMPVLAVSVQNAAPHEDIGAATSILNFFRSLGSAFGVALLGTVLSTRAAGSFGSGLDERVLHSPERIRALPDALHDAAVHGVAEGVAAVFLIATVLAAVATVLSWLLRETPLRDMVAPLAATEGLEGLSGLLLDSDDPLSAGNAATHVSAR